MLGGFDVHLDSCHAVAVASPRMRALLAYLAMEGARDHEREVLAELIWGSVPLARARNYLRHCVWELRGLLERPSGVAVFASSKHTLRLMPEVYVDALAFAAADSSITDEERLSLYRGEFLAGLSLPDSPPFDDWLQVQREALHRRALALLEQLANRHALTGNVSAALKYALRQVELEPWAEDAQRRVMRLYAMNGQPGAAQAHYEICRRQLEQELGVLPSAETQALAQRIRQGELPLAPLAPLAPPATHATPQLTLATQPLAAERRQVSVLYCELAHAGLDDPDEAMELLHAPQARCVEIIREFSGHIVQVYGGGLLAYFGYPQAREDAARRAVQAALAVARGGIDAPELGIEIRAGVHTGLIITGGDTAMPDTVGKTSRLAIQLRQCLLHSGVAISEETHHLVGGYFECASLYAPSFPAALRPRNVFHVSGASGAQSRLEAAASLTPLVGRQEELALLIERWREAAGGQWRVVLLRGEAGIGKSRLLLTLRKHLDGQSHAIREMRCFPETAPSPFHPLIAMIENLCGFLPEDSAAARAAKLTAYLELHFPEQTPTARPLLSALLSLPATADAPAPTLSPRQQKEATNALLLDLLAIETAQQPVLLIVEDLHWLDPSTRELIDLFVARGGRGALLAVFTARPEFVPAWPEHLVTPMDLAPLPDAEVAAIVDTLVSGLPAVARSNIVQRADGIPLFAEEMSKISRVDPNAGIPPTLLDLLAARIDTLGEAKTSAQLAAALGREFDLTLLREISPHPPAILRQHLDALQEAGLVLPDMNGISQFKHALIQEAAYQSQSKATRRAAHRRIADVLQKDFAEIVAHQPELLAQHLGAGGETLAAIDYWVMAAQQAASKSANQEAAGHFAAALELVAALPAGPQHDGVEFNLRIGLAPVLCATKGYGAREVACNNGRIGELANIIEDSPELFPAKWAMTIGTLGAAGSRGMPQAVGALLVSAQGDAVRKIAAHLIGAISSLWEGDFAASIDHDDRIVALYRPEFRTLLIDQFGSDLTVFSADYAGLALWLTGFPEQAQARVDRALARARDGAHPHTLSQSLSFAALLTRWRGGLPAAAGACALAAEAIEIAQRHDMPLWIASASMTHGWARTLLGEVDAGIEEIRRAIAIAREALSGISVVYIAPLIEACVHLERYDEALALIGQAQAEAKLTGDDHYTAELLRLTGESLLGRSASNAEEAEECFTEALTVSHRQQAKSLELRAAMSTARLWLGQGRTDAAHALLADVYGRFSEGFDSHDLRLAAEMLRRPG